MFATDSVSKQTLRVFEPGFETHQGQEVLLQTVQTAPGIHIASYLVGIGFLSRG